MEDCWIYLGPFESKWGATYGRYHNDRAHRRSYETFKGPIPEGLTIDHLCRETLCINPDHLEAVTRQENSRRGNCASAVHARMKVCVKGHEFVKVGGRRQCYECQRENKKIYYRKPGIKEHRAIYHKAYYTRNR